MTNEINTQVVTTEAAVEAFAADTAVKKTRVEKLTESYGKKRAAYDKLADEMEKLVEKKRAAHEKLAAELTEIVDEINAINALSNIGQGSEVLLTIGKGETLTQVKATVLAVREDADGKKEFKVAYGAGFDADVKVVGISKLAPIPAEGAAE